MKKNIPHIITGLLLIVTIYLAFFAEREQLKSSAWLVEAEAAVGTPIPGVTIDHLGRASRGAQVEVYRLTDRKSKVLCYFTGASTNSAGGISCMPTHDWPISVSVPTGM